MFQVSDDRLIFRKRLLAGWFGCLSISMACLLHSAPIRAEGSAQIGLNQRLLDFDMSLAQGYAIDSNSASLYVDIVTAGEVINISLCGATNTDNISIEILDPTDVSVFTTSLTDGNVDCADAMDAPLTAPVRYTTAATGAYRLVLQNSSGATFASSIFERYDISVTPNLVTNPDPSVAAGRLWAYSWNFNAGSFDEVDSTDADYFVLVPGGRPNTNYVWQLALNRFAGFGYNIIANEIGVNAPNSGYSTPKNGNAATYLFSVYTGVPAIADPLPSLPPSVTNTRFIDSDGTDSGISPGDTDGIQDSGTFEFESDVTGTYGIFIDIDQDGTFGNAGDVLLLGSVDTGLNQVPWDGTDALGIVLPVGAYNAQINVRMGEYHFVANDVETSGGPAADGMTIFLSDLAGNTSNTQIYWDDVTVLGAGAGGLSTLPLGESSGVAAGRHTWGNFSSTGFGNERFIDTYVFGLTTKATVTPRVTSDNALLTGVDGTVDISDGSLPGDTLTIMVTDADLNTNGGITESVVVDVVNDVTGELEQVLLTETDVDSGVFVGTLLTAPGAVADANNNGAMNTQSTNTITVTYTDAIDAVGASVPRTDVSTVDTDTDGDGVGDTNDADPADPCVPGFPSASCPDTDNDGAADSGTPTTSVPVEPDAGADNDPCVPDNSVPVCDTDNDGISDGDEIANGTDPNDSDSDGDGIPDGAENTDADGDGINDASDNDSDNDGIPDSVEAGPMPAMPIDSDNDGLPDFVDPDADNDGIPDSVEGFVDSDTDGVADYLDPDSDDDGLPDTIEDDVAFGVDMDNDGIDDGYDVSFSGGIDADGDGVDDALDPSRF